MAVSRVWLAAELLVAYRWNSPLNGDGTHRPKCEARPVRYPIRCGRTRHARHFGSIHVSRDTRAHRAMQQGAEHVRLDEVIACEREISKRKLIGRLVRDEVALQCTVEELAEAANMSSPAMYQVFNADWTVSVVRLRSVQ